MAIVSHIRDDESHWGSSPSSLMANTREQLPVQSNQRFDFNVVTEKGHDTLLCNRGLCASKGIFELQNNVVTTPKGGNRL